VIDISIDTHRELYHDWRAAIAFCRTLPDVSPPEHTPMHLFWRERRGRWSWGRRRFGRKQLLPVKAYLATQDLSMTSLTIWSDTDLTANELLRPWLPYLQTRIYDPEIEVRDTPLERHPAVYRQRDRRVYRDGDLFRILILYKYGGVYADMDTVLLRSLGVFLDQEFVYQWDNFDDKYAPAQMHRRKGGAFVRELVDGLIELAPGKYNWGRENLARAMRRGCRVPVLPSAFFNTEWQADPAHEPFKNTPQSANFYDGAFAWHWHNRWDEPIEAGSKFDRLDQAMDARLLAAGFPCGPR
jgi:hypothetical protein